MAHVSGDFNGEWFNLNTTAGIPAGTEMKLQNQSSHRVVLQESSTQPASDDWTGEIMTTLLEAEPSKVVPEGSGSIWVRSSELSRVSIFAQEV